MKHWPLLIIVPCTAILVYACAYVALVRKRPPVIGVGYFVSLCVALAACGFLFDLWEETLRNAFGGIYVRGSVDGTPVERYRQFSEECFASIHSHYRFVPILLCVFVSFVVNWIVGIEVLRAFQFNAERLLLLFFGGTMAVTIVAWSYSVGAVAWCFAVVGYSIWRLPRVVRLRMHFGHPDHCGGLSPFGECCLGMVYPLLIGIVLLALWSSPALLPWTLNAVDNDLGKRYVRMLHPVVRMALGACVPLTAAVLFVPLWPMHRKMKQQKMDYTRSYASQYDHAVRALMTEAGGRVNDQNAKDSRERLDLLDKFSPQALKISDWPVNGIMLAKYAGAALGVLASFNQGLFALIKKVFG